MDAKSLFPNAEYEAFPVCTQVTLVHGVCDSRCVSCPVGRVRFGDADAKSVAELGPRQHQLMRLELFQKVADEVARYPHAWLRLHARGEPLLHPDFVAMVSYAKRAGVRLVQAFTDAVRLDEKMSQAILAAGLDVLECSVHGHTHTYERLMRNGKHQQVVDNIIAFRRLRDASGAPTRLVVSAVDQPEFQVEKEDHRAFWKQHADQVIYRPYHSWGNRIQGPCAAQPEQRHPCAQLWTRCTVGPGGKVLACFNSWSEPDEDVLGDLSLAESSIAAVWQSAHNDRIREDHVEGCYSLSCCRTCRDWVGSAWGSNSYEHLLEQGLQLGRDHDN
ncbi:MAG: radical SAM protein [Candidatus Accumulibacter meliphilus]|jgi:hypothetical protein|uniref:radical SAM/SPASM domain-containing protein n=1 Tax=Candidatus Accumulibacter meliphilus TaxID=2211374 RepID=UPI002FC2995B